MTVEEEKFFLTCKKLEKIARELQELNDFLYWGDLKTLSFVDKATGNKLSIQYKNNSGGKRK